MMSIGGDATLREALERMLQEEVEHLPVMDGGRMVGMCTHTDILRARHRRFEREHRQPGWRSARKAGRNPAS
ncbi:MAG TPA: hypothetical protein DIT48_06420 [Actinobacteria bacterium]|nr:hypothetical protein [Actinomycetota bacterium]HCP61062.1 hypothetical protein [Actinomycetota bacterium]